MKTRYKITIIILLIIGIPISPIMVIDYVYANTNTPQFAAVSTVFCPYFPIPDDFVANQIFFAVYSTNPIIQLERIHYSFYSVCYKETEDPPLDLGPEYDPLNSKGCPQFCPKKDRNQLDLQKILDNCKEKKKDKDLQLPFLHISNGTHYINNGICKWKSFDDPVPKINLGKTSDGLSKEMSIVIIPKGAAIEGNPMLIPDEITVVLGENNTVIWINQDDTSHGITSDYEPNWGSSRVLKPGDSFSVTFNHTGVFEYHGAPHPWMNGKVIVLGD